MWLRLPVALRVSDTDPASSEGEHTYQDEKLGGNQAADVVPKIH